VRYVGIDIEQRVTGWWWWMRGAGGAASDAVRRGPRGLRKLREALGNPSTTC